MEAKLSLFQFSTLIVAFMLHGSLAQTTHVVGDALGWVVPPGGDIAYQTWAAARTFVVGDVLVFNFTTNQHDVAEVNTEAFDSCNTTNPISLSATSPTNITLRSVGEHHFICTFSRHCPLGQKLAINVLATPPPETAPSPAAGVGMTYTVGDSLGWVVPPGGSIAYQTWVRGKTFMVGDILVFNFTSGVHNVVSVTRAEFESCTISATTTPPTTTSPARITLTSGGEHYYMCTVPRHCSLGQKLAINVTGGATATPPSSSAAPPPSSTSGGPTSSTPSTPSTPGPVSAPPPPSNSAPSFATATFPFTFLVVVLAFL
ncbi:hypothetical protein ACS0TY_024127 [Phlomoides rotata]